MRGIRWRLERVVWDLGMGSVVGLLSGGASALFLLLLERVIRLREQHLWLLALLPLFGMITAWLYQRWGKESEQGGSLILDEVMEFKGRVPTRMAPWCWWGRCSPTSVADPWGGKAQQCKWAPALPEPSGRSLGRG
jgi:H+/Cl- antiporter ClcA